VDAGRLRGISRARISVAMRIGTDIEMRDYGFYNVTH
jgi:hypothetical protein